uniref:Pleckstrin homology domain-containing family B member 1 n=1 Tax=Geotrypetes seraphini TaxID=260995 RepID=A0A6P8R8B7_GEOSA|nr:pleckstrin homology domain-containing family B member 1 [Geotrypetes seraphini]XP_033804435.1 pleckstrin homology domain-containing family B member 1 [Geotrypetes seraphini]
MALVKSGWLWRKSSIMRRWKKRWFDLWNNGVLVYYSDDGRHPLKGVVFLRFNCTDVKVGQEFGGVQPPEGQSRNHLIKIFLRNNIDEMLCAESEDDAIAWKTALLQQKANVFFLYNPFDGFNTVPQQIHHVTSIHPGPYSDSRPYNGYNRGPRMTQVVIPEDPYHMLRNNRALGLLTGVLTGTAIGSLLWSPFWF